MGLRRAILLLLFVVPLGCDEPTPEPAVDEVEQPVSPSAPEASRPADEAVAAISAPVLAAAPAEGCAVQQTRDLGGGGWADVAAFGQGFVVAMLTTEGDTERLRLLDVAGPEPRLVAQATLDLPAGTRRASGPVLSAQGEQLAVAYVDGGSRLRLAVFAGRPRLTPRTVAEGASLRFRPALAHQDGQGDAGWAVAWTNAHDTPMRVLSRALAADGQPLGEERDHTPLAGGAAAPAMVVGANPLRLVFLDPRQATSVCLRSTWADGGFGPAEVARPVGLVTEPPEIAAVQLGGEDWLAYTGIGGLATTAVGWVSLGGPADPGLLVPGTGYGTLHVDGDRLGDGAVVVADAPRAAPPASPREVRFHAVSRGGALGETLVIAGPNEEADRARVAARPDGRVAVAFRSAGNTRLTDVRCAVPADDDSGASEP